MNITRLLRSIGRDIGVAAILEWLTVVFDIRSSRPAYGYRFVNTGEEEQNAKEQI